MCCNADVGAVCGETGRGHPSRVSGYAATDLANKSLTPYISQGEQAREQGSRETAARRSGRWEYSSPGRTEVDRDMAGFQT